MDFPIIGLVKSPCRKTDPHSANLESTIEVYEEFEKGLDGLEENEYMQVLFHFHLSEPCALRQPTCSGRIRGVFASRSPRRPSGIGVTTVKLLERRGRELRVSGLDALDGTPVLDLKPYAAVLDEPERARVESEYSRRNPRREILRQIRKLDLPELLCGAGRIHGHFCPGLAMGVMAGAHAMNRIRGISDGMEHILALVETNNCFSDGVQHATGCTFGNNALIFLDYGKTAMTLADRSGNGFRVSVRPDFKANREQDLPEFRELFSKVLERRAGTTEDENRFKDLAAQKAFALLDMEFSRMFSTQDVRVELPRYAPIHENFVCAKCGETAMASRMCEKGGEVLCIPCAGSHYMRLTGHGIEGM